MHSLTEFTLQALQIVVRAPQHRSSSERFATPHNETVVATAPNPDAFLGEARILDSFTALSLWEHSSRDLQSLPFGRLCLFFLRLAPSRCTRGHFFLRLLQTERSRLDDPHSQLVEFCKKVGSFWRKVEEFSPKLRVFGKRLLFSQSYHVTFSCLAVHKQPMRLSSKKKTLRDRAKAR